MQNKSFIKEIAVGLGLGLITNILSSFVLEQTNIYIISSIFVLVLFIYYLSWIFVIKPLLVNRKVKLKDVFVNYKKAKSSINTALQESSNIKIMSVGGSAVTGDDREKMLDTISQRALAGAQVKILLLNPTSPALDARFDELRHMKFAKGQIDDMKRYITNSAHKILSRNEAIEVRYYDHKPVWRLYVLDKWAFVSFYLGDKEGHDTSIIMIERGSDLFSAIERYFDSVWEASQMIVRTNVA